jgi:hypothetical protein
MIQAVNKVDILGHLAMPINAPLRLNIGIDSTFFLKGSNNGPYVSIWDPRKLRTRVSNLQKSQNITGGSEKKDPFLFLTFFFRSSKKSENEQ